MCREAGVNAGVTAEVYPGVNAGVTAEVYPGVNAGVTAKVYPGVNAGVTAEAYPGVNAGDCRGVSRCGCSCAPTVRKSLIPKISGRITVMRVVKIWMMTQHE